LNVIFVLIAVSLLVAIGFLVAFIWSIRNGQFDDEYTPSVRILFDDEIKQPAGENQIPNSKFQIPSTKNQTNSKNQTSKPQNPKTPKPVTSDQ
jgi:cbb3-type cytochrome oxidase maturation protein